MIIEDIIYGKQEVSDPLAKELLKSDTLSRLKNISQQGMPQELWPWPVFDRFSHSVGTYLLLKKIGASLPEQIAGILHDVSHTAFSHITDWIENPGGDEDDQDKRHTEYIRNNEEITNILEKHGFSIQEISHLEKFKILDRDIPDICADRIDYFLRELKLWKNSKIIPDILGSIAVLDEGIVFKSEESALIFAQEFLETQTNHWASSESVRRYFLFAKILQESLEKKIINEKDFEKDDKFVLDKIYASGGEDLISRLDEFKNKNTKPLGLIQEKKFRWIDPKVATKDGVRRISDISKDFGDLLKKKREENKKGVKI